MHIDDVFLALDQLGTKLISGTYYRHTAPRRDPLSGEGSRMVGGRWNRPGTEALYLAAPLDCCSAEFRRMAMGQGRGAESFLPRTLHTISVTELETIDLTHDASRAAVGLEPGDIAADLWETCQVIGDAVDTLGVGGLLAPSATETGNVLTVFVRHAHHQQLEVVNSKVVDSSSSW